MRVTVIATGFDEKKKPETKGIYSSAGAARTSAPIPTDPAAGIDDIDEIFKIFNK